MNKLKITFVFAIVALFTFASCEKEENTTLSASQIYTLAENIYSCFSEYGDNEEQLINYMRAPSNQADYEALKDAFGSRKCKSLLENTMHNLEGMINCNIGEKDRKRIKDILSSKGIYNYIN